MRWRPIASELVHMSLDPFLPCTAAVACDAFGPASSGTARTSTRFQASAGTEVLGAGFDEQALPTDSDEVRVHERHRAYTRWYVAVGAEALVLALLIVIVGRQLTQLLGVATPGGGAAAWVHDLLVESRQLLARMSGAGVRTWLPSILAALLTIMGPWLRRLAARWGLGILTGSRAVSALTWLVVAVAGVWGLS